MESRKRRAQRRGRPDDNVDDIVITTIVSVRVNVHVRRPVLPSWENCFAGRREDRIRETERTRETENGTLTFALCRTSSGARTFGTFCVTARTMNEKRDAVYGQCGTGGEICNH
jgi:hypothetical protein